MNKDKFYVRHVSFNEETGGTDISEKYEEYFGKVVPLQDQRDMQLYGESSRNMRVCELRKRYATKIMPGDYAYIGLEPKEEKHPGNKANFVVKNILTANQFSNIYFEKMSKEDVL